MNSRFTAAAIAALLSLPLALQAADKPKKNVTFAAADADKDGKVSVSEYVVAMKGKLDDGAARAKFAELDKDKNGSLSREEFEGRTGEKKARKAKNGGADAASTEPRMPRQ